MRIDPESRTVTARIEVPDHPCWITGNETSLWVAPSEAAYVEQFDAASGKSMRRVEIGSGPADPKLALAFGDLWATVTPSGEVVRITLDGEVAARIATGADPRSLIEGDGLMWVANETAGTITAIDPETNEVVRTLPVEHASALVAYTGGSLWVGRLETSDVIRVDPTDGKIVATYEVGGNPSPGLVVDGHVWVPNHLVSTLSVISVADGTVDTVDVGRYPSGLLEVGDDIWIANYGDGNVSIIPKRRG